MHAGRPFCWNNTCWDNGTRGQRNEGDLPLAQNESTAGLWIFRSQHLHPELFYICVFVLRALPPLRLNIFEMFKIAQMLSAPRLLSRRTPKKTQI